MEPSELRFGATLRPNRSLGPVGFRLVMAAVIAIGLATGIAYAVIGAWPVLGFFGLDIALVYWAFRQNYRDGELCEHVRLGESILEVERLHPGGRWERWVFQPYWVRLTVDETRDDDPVIELSERGVSVRLGAFLSADERLSFGAALQGALASARSI